jgi:hypothetical protein
MENLHLCTTVGKETNYVQIQFSQNFNKQGCIIGQYICFFVVKVMMMAGGEGTSSPKAPRPYRQALCAPF